MTNTKLMGVWMGYVLAISFAVPGALLLAMAINYITYQIGVPTPDQLYNCTAEQQAPNGDCP